MDVEAWKSPSEVTPLAAALLNKRRDSHLTYFEVVLNRFLLAASYPEAIHLVY